MLLASEPNLQAAADHLARHDPVLRPVIEEYGLAQFAPHDDYYGALVSSIIGQQLSIKAAAAIRQRFIDIFGGHFPTPEQILSVDVERMRSIGFSYAKGRYVHDLAQHVLDGRISFKQLPQQSNQEIIDLLTDVKGVGEWTVHMFLMFCVGRLDVLPTGDLGVRNGIRMLYDLLNAPSPTDMRTLAEQNHWHPYESVASWYIWRALENEPVTI